MAAFRVRLHCLGDDDRQATSAWLESSGMTLMAPGEGTRFEIQMVSAPEVLLQTYYWQGFLSVSRISCEGVVFYLTELAAQKAKITMTSANADGVLFCPMSNIVCINDFGRFDADSA